MANSTAIIFGGAVAAPTALGQRNPLWTPATLTGLVSEWDTDAGLVQDTATPPAVASWTARTGAITGAMTLTQVAAAVTREGAMNGRVPVRLNSGRGLAFSRRALAADRLWYMFVDIAALPASGSSTLFYFGAASLVVFASGSLQHYPDSAGQFSTAAGAVAAGMALIVVYRDAADNRLRIRVNGNEAMIAAAAVTSAAIAETDGRVGNNLQGDRPITDMKIGAFGVATGVRSLLEVQKLEGYLAQRYSGATFLPQAHPYRAVAPRKLT